MSLGHRFKNLDGLGHEDFLFGDAVVFAHLDIGLGDIVTELVKILTGLPGHVGYIIIEHDMDVALRVSDMVTMMHNGRIFKEGKPAEIEDDPEVQALYLGGDDE